ncbi:MAG: hypothetical protein ACRDQU_20770 [Pseudonocardiaceae bacterium]
MATGEDVTEHSVTATDRTPEPLTRCLRCGERIIFAGMGRPRRYCGDTCRQAGHRLRRRHGYGWWRDQPWYPDWRAEYERERAERPKRLEAERLHREAQRREREEHEAVVAAMPPVVRQGYEEARRAENARWRAQMAKSTLELALATFKLSHEKTLAETGMTVVMLHGSKRVEKLLWAAVQTGNEAEAAALFAKARQIVAAGELTAAELPADPDEELRRIFRQETAPAPNHPPGADTKGERTDD